MKKFLVALFFVCTPISFIWAQKANDFKLVDKFALQIPDSLTGSIADISSYFNSGLTKTSDKARAA